MYSREYKGGNCLAASRGVCRTATRGELGPWPADWGVRADDVPGAAGEGEEEKMEDSFDLTDIIEMALTGSWWEERVSCPTRRR
jgi:hypothetical protein